MKHEKFSKSTYSHAMNNQNIVDFPGNISVIDTHYYRKQVAASHLIVNNGAAAFVDTGPSPSRDYLLDALKQKGLSPGDVRYIILTHIHLDHAGGAGTMMQCCPEAQLVVHHRGVYHMVNPEKLINATIAIYGPEIFQRIYREIVATPASRVITAEEGLVLDLNGRPLHFLDTPGHARHHCCIWDPDSRGIFTGDTMGLAYPELQMKNHPPFLIPTTTPAAFDPLELKQSISRLQELNADFYYLTHYGPIVADTEAVHQLTRMIDTHADLARHPGKSPALSARLLELYHEAYCRYSGKKDDLKRLKTILAGDIELNSQGLAIWAERQERENREQ